MVLRWLVYFRSASAPPVALLLSGAMARRLLVCLLAAAACGGATGPSSPAANGVRAYLAALKSNDPHDAYKMMSSSARKKVSYDEFALQWKQTEKERAWQVKVLED